jgi:hypothetical protein
VSARQGVPQTADYFRQFRLDHPDYVALANRRKAARGRALENLRREHPAEFARLYQVQLGQLHEQATP